MKGEVLFISAVCFTKLLLPVCLGGNRKNSSLNSGPSCDFRQRFSFLCSSTDSLSSFLCFCLMGHALKDGP